MTRRLKEQTLAAKSLVQVSLFLLFSFFLPSVFFFFSFIFLFLLLGEICVVPLPPIVPSTTSTTYIHLVIHVLFFDQISRKDPHFIFQEDTDRIERINKRADDNLSKIQVPEIRYLQCN